MLGISMFAAVWYSGLLSLARRSRSGNEKIALIVFELLIQSVLTSEVSIVPGCWLLRKW